MAGGLAEVAEVRTQPLAQLLQQRPGPGEDRAALGVIGHPQAPERLFRLVQPSLQGPHHPTAHQQVVWASDIAQKVDAIGHPAQLAPFVQLQVEALSEEGVELPLPVLQLRLVR
jgi:hypothetical protein